MKNNQIAIIIVVAILMGVGGFFAGMKYQQNQKSSISDFQNMRGTRQNPPADMQLPNGNSVRGEIIEKDGDNITVKSVDESSKIVIISENTEIHKASTATIDDLVVGEQVMIFGQKNSDGSITAQNVQLNPAFKERVEQEPK